MSLAEGVSARATFKFYPDGVIHENTLDDVATLPGATGGQALRRVSMTPSLKKAAYQSNEIRTDRQVVDFRHGTRSVQGGLAGELSPATYFDWIEAIHRDTRVAAMTLLPLALTSVAADSASSTFILGGGDPVALGLRVGHPIRFTGLSAAANNNKTFVVQGFSGTTNTVVKVYPAPVTQGADVTFTLARPGASTIVPSTGFVSRKMALEVFDDDIGTGQLFLENRLASYKISMPATGLTTIDFTLQGRAANSIDAPYFTAPAEETTTGICAAVNGQLLLGGVAQGVVTALDLTVTLAATPAEVVGQDFAAEIFLGRAIVTGTMTAFLNSNALIDAFTNEEELELLVRLDTEDALDSPSISIYLPRIKLSSADVNYTGEGGQSVSAAFQALKYVGTDPGKPQTTIMVTDTEVVP